MEKKKFSIDSIDDKIFDFVYHEALGDATQQRALQKTNKKDFLDKMSKKDNDAKNAVQSYIADIIAGELKEKEAHDKKFYATIKSILDYADCNDFTFGNAQKLINMTAKYFYIMCYKNDNLRKKFANCHCPMDSIMIKKVREKYKEQINKTWQLKSDTAWSKLEMDEKNNIPKAYEEFQNLIKNNKENRSPLEFDFFEWNNEK